jgi:hypothetical protein
MVEGRLIDRASARGHDGVEKPVSQWGREKREPRALWRWEIFIRPVKGRSGAKAVDDGEETPSHYGFLILMIEERKVYGRGSGRRGGATDGCSWWLKGL